MNEYDLYDTITETVAGALNKIKCQRRCQYTVIIMFKILIYLNV